MRSELGENWKHEEREGNFRGSFLDKGGAAREGVWGKKGRNWGGGAVAAVWRGLGPFGEFSAHFSKNGEKKGVQLRGGGASSDHAPSPCADW